MGRVTKNARKCVSYISILDVPIRWMNPTNKYIVERLIEGTKHAEALG